MAKKFLGQAAMEYLVTYGWALLALFMVIAFLMSSGVFSPNNFSTQECTFQPDLPCSSFIIYNTAGTPGLSTIEFTLTNNLGFPINISNVTYTAMNMGKDGKGEYSGTAFPPGTILPGQKMSFLQDFRGDKQPGGREFKTVMVAMTYMNCRANPCTGKYTTSGRISTTVETKQPGAPSA